MSPCSFTAQQNVQKCDIKNGSFVLVNIVNFSLLISGRVTKFLLCVCGEGIGFGWATVRVKECVLLVIVG